MPMVSMLGCAASTPKRSANVNVGRNREISTGRNRVSSLGSGYRPYFSLCFFAYLRIVYGQLPEILDARH
jgi:hypothetical protein